MERIFHLDEISEVARLLLEESPYKVIGFYGEMGSGKTTLIREILRHAGITTAVASPTFSLVNEYRSPGGDMYYHFDFYRLKDPVEALDIGLDEYLASGSYCLIEWPEKIREFMPVHSFSVYLEIVNENQRRLITR